MADDYAKGCSPPRAFSGISHYGRHDHAISNVPYFPTDMSIIQTSTGAAPAGLCPGRVHPQHCATVQCSRRYCQRHNQRPPILHKITTISKVKIGNIPAKMYSPHHRYCSFRSLNHDPSSAHGRIDGISSVPRWHHHNTHLADPHKLYSQ